MQVCDTWERCNWSACFYEVQDNMESWAISLSRLKGSSGTKIEELPGLAIKGEETHALWGPKSSITTTHSNLLAQNPPLQTQNLCSKA